MRSFVINIALLIICTGSGLSSFSQIKISGTVYDSSKLYTVPDVMVYNTAGKFTVTDSTGNYTIDAAATDSIYFFYGGKNSVKYPVAELKDYTGFDISLHTKVDQKYKMLKGVTVFSNSYEYDSLQNRIKYQKVFGGSKPHIETTFDPGGPAGIGLESLIGVFQFRKNKQWLAFQKRLIEQEEDAYVDYKFNSKTITRITGLTGENLSTYKKLYRPTYDFVANASLVQFYQYILNTSYAFKNREKK